MLAHVFFSRCPVKIVVRVRHLHENYIAKAGDKKRFNYPTVIKITGIHNHQIVNANALKELRVLPKIKEMFLTYFDLGKYLEYYIR